MTRHISVKFRRARPFRFAAPLAILCLILLGCGGSPAPQNTTLPTQPTSPPTVATTAPAATPTGAPPFAASATPTVPPSPTVTATATDVPTVLQASTQAATATAAATSLPPAQATAGTPPPTPTTGPTATPAPTFAVPPGFPTETPSPNYLSWARPGAYRSPYTAAFTLESFSSSTPLVTTYFFYWFDFAGKMGGSPPRTGINPFLPPNASSITFIDPSWYEKEFNDMLDAGIDFVLPDYWGEPGQYARRVAPAPMLNYFATQGLPPMIEALSRLRSRGRNLKVGLFLDTTILNDEDLTSERGKQIFYASIRDYYSRIPPVYWAAIDNRPIVWLYDAQKVGNFNQSTFDYVYEQFAKDFGGLKPYIVRELQWYQARGETNEVIKTEGLYNWGAAPSGFNPDTRFTVAEVGPGFGNTQFGGSGRIFTDRQGGKFYEDNLIRALRARRKILAVETWNELGEASGILETVQFGRQYINLTRKYVDLFKAGRIP